MTKWEVAVGDCALLGEAPFWDSIEKCLWFVDVVAGKLNRLDPATATVTSRTLEAPLSAAIPTADGDLVVLHGNEVSRYDWIEDTRRGIAALYPRDPTLQLNDAACDPRGRLWAGTIDAGYARGRSTLLRFATQQPDIVLSARGLANGIAWSPDGQTMYFSDSQRRVVETFAYDVETGWLSEGRVWRQFDESDGFPDGLTVDDAGDVWVALYCGWAVHHFTAEATLVEVLEFPVERVSNLCFGGPQLSDLFVTTSAHRMTAPQRDAQPLAGATFVVPDAGKGRSGQHWRPETMA